MVTHCFVGLWLQAINTPQMQLSPGSGHGEFSVILKRRGRLRFPHRVPHRVLLIRW